jgi:hypothetical protein
LAPASSLPLHVLRWKLTRSFGVKPAKLRFNGKICQAANPWNFCVEMNVKPFSIWLGSKGFLIDIRYPREKLGQTT